MAYYRGDYYRGPRRGDFYRGRMQRGDPFWGALWSGIKTVGGALLGAAIKPSSAGGVSGVIQAGQSQPANMGAIGFMQTPQIGAGTWPMRQAPPPMTPMPSSPRMEVIDGQIVRRKRRMNPANSKALNRSIRRVVGFGRLASRSRRAVGKAATALQCFRRTSTRARKR